MEIGYNINHLYVITFKDDFNGVLIPKAFLCRIKNDKYYEFFSNKKIDTNKHFTIEELTMFYTDKDIYKTKLELYNKIIEINNIKLLVTLDNDKHKKVLEELGIYDESKLFYEEKRLVKKQV